ncbi:hypothetical protein ABEB36_005801 [Hypothenemus hampei]|uniref:Uncharacterized protein n=1 Tax=Hypothenemus hampei TaxID=57062 RepID=A0ABD1EZG5_HYPHA
MERLRNESLLNNDTTEKHVKAKIKSIKDPFRQELEKLQRILTGDSNISSEVLKYFESDSDDKEHTEQLNVNTMKRKIPSSPKELCSVMKSPSDPFSPKKSKRSLLLEIGSALSQLDRIATTVTNTNSSEQFGQYFATQLRSLSKIENFITARNSNSITQTLLHSYSSESTPVKILTYVKLDTPSAWSYSSCGHNGPSNMYFIYVFKLSFQYFTTTIDCI